MKSEIISTQKIIDRIQHFVMRFALQSALFMFALLICKLDAMADINDKSDDIADADVVELVDGVGVYVTNFLEANPNQKLYLTQSGGYYYFMLPSSAVMDKLVFKSDAGSLIMGGSLSDNIYMNVNSGDNMTMGLINEALGGQVIEIDVRILKESKLPAVFIDTKSGSMTKIDSDEKHEYKESGQMVVLSEDGALDYVGELKSIKGRGNFTWGGCKKPYNLKLKKEASLLGMSKEKDWCLLANYFDSSRMRNQIVFDMAKAVGDKYPIDYRNVDLYLNGRYNGVYMLTEKVEVGTSRINIYDLESATQKANELGLSEYIPAGIKEYKPSTCMYSDIPNNPKDITGGYILELEYKSRYSNADAGFVTDRGLAITLKAPEYVTKKQIEYIRGYFQDFEDAVYSENGINNKGIHYSEYVDLDDMATQYIIQEFTQNRDALNSSFYLYKDSDKRGDGKLHATTAWDFDMSLGNTGDDLAYQVTDWICINKKSVFAILASKPEMKAALVNKWNSSFRPYLDELINGKLKQDFRNIKGSLSMDAIKWPNYLVMWYREEQNYANEYDIIDKYINNRTSFINDRLHAGDVFGN